MQAPAQGQFGRRVLASRVDELAWSQPDKVFASFPPSYDLSKGFRDVTYAEFANAVNRASFWIEETFSGKGVEFETIGYIGEGDIRYFILMLAGNKTGYKVHGSGDMISIH